MHVFAGAELAQDAVRPEPEPPETEAGVRGTLRRGRHATFREDSGKGAGGGCGCGCGWLRSWGLGSEGVVHPADANTRPCDATYTPATWLLSL